MRINKINRIFIKFYFPAVNLPGLASPKKLPMTRKDNRVVITMPDAPIYSVIVIE